MQLGCIAMGFSNDDLNCIYDKNDGYCVYCGKRLAFKNYGKRDERGGWEIDHSVPKSRGGTDYLRNLVPACIDCNRQKGTRMGKSVRASVANSSGDWSGVALGVVVAVGLVYLAYHLSRPKQQ